MDIEYSFHEIFKILMKIAKKNEKNIIYELDSSALTLKQLFLIDAIAELKNPGIDKLIEYSNLRKSTIEVIIDKLSRRGLIRKFKSDNKKTFYVIITKKGDEIINLKNKFIQNFSDYFIKNLENEDRESLIKILNKLVNNSLIEKQ